MPAIAPFTGFPPAGLAFLDGLAADNSKAYFHANRDPYQECLLEPAKSFVADLGDWLASSVDDEIQAVPAVNGSLFRINRDIRFSADKTPYKTNLALFFWKGADRKTSPGLYVGLDTAGMTLGVGAMALDVERWRTAIADQETGAAWERAVEAAQQNCSDALDIDGEALKRVPRPYAQDHPRGRWLRHKAVRMARHQPLPEAVSDAAFVGWCGERLRPFAGVLDWLATHTTPKENDHAHT